MGFRGYTHFPPGSRQGWIEAATWGENVLGDGSMSGVGKGFCSVALEGSTCKITALFERLAIDGLRESSRLAVSRRIRLTWPEIDGIMQRAVRRGLARPREEVVPLLGVDEKSFQGRRYVTAVCDLTNDRASRVSDDRRRDDRARLERVGEDRLRQGSRGGEPQQNGRRNSSLGDCGRPGYDKVGPRRSRHLDTCQHKTIVEVEIPRCECPDHGVLQGVVLWAQQRSILLLTSKHDCRVFQPAVRTATLSATLTFPVACIIHGPRIESDLIRSNPRSSLKPT